MNLHWIDIGIIVTYLIVVAIIGFWVKNRATAGLDNYYLAGRNIPWWLLGFAGCSSYIDIGGTMAMVGALFFLGLKSVWMTHIFWGWFIIAGYMAFQAKWIRRSGVMTFAEWNQTRFGNNRDAEMARIASAAFLLLLMIFNLIYIAVGIGKFAEEFLPFSRLGSTLIVFSIVGIYVTLAGMIGVIITDIIQTILIAFGAVFLTFLAFSIGAGSNITDLASNGWRSLEPTWTLWSGFLESTPDSYHHFYFFGPLMMAGFGWMLFRVLAGPNVWDFQFFLTARSPRDAALAGGMWTVGYTMRWFIGVAFLVLGMHYLNLDSGVELATVDEPATLTLGESTTQSLPVEPSLEPSAIPMSDTKSFDSEKIIPRVLSRLPIGIRGLFMAVLLAALMSTLDAMINITSSVVVNDFLKRYFLKKLKEKQLVRLGQLASLVALLLGLVFSISFEDIISIWEMMVLVVVTMILVPSTMRWHWWRFSARAFVLSMVTSAAMIV
ncbi:MAG: hypothetical protein KAU50_12665, partial [Candidatus Marinimicrobia bacterium]|nr:hypothetical protein [Candidatus Neomarinimicrobiota bacterium]